MKTLNNFIQEKLHISKFNEEINFNKDIEEDIMEMIFNFCSLFYNVNNFFTDDNMQKCIKDKKVENEHTKEVIEALIYFFKKSNNKIGIKIIEAYPNQYKEEIDDAIIKGIQKHYDIKKK